MNCIASKKDAIAERVLPTKSLPDMRHISFEGRNKENKTDLLNRHWPNRLLSKRNGTV
jgi:hypothetical protein